MLHIILHLVGWCIFFVAPFTFFSNSVSFSDYLATRFNGGLLFLNVIIVIYFYLNARIFVPRLLFMKRPLMYFFSAFAFIGIPLIYTRVQHSPRYGPPFWVRNHDALLQSSHLQHPNFSGLMLLFLLVWAVSLLIAIFSKLISTEKRVIVVEADKKAAELSFLKAQINPHFLFNTLNNIYSLSIAGSTKTSDAIMRLSTIMRYVTNDVHIDLVPLADEIGCITNYIELQKLRLSPETMTLLFDVQGDTLNTKIAPLIFMPFVENAFKYGVSNNVPAKITIIISIKDNRIEMNVTNTIFKMSHNFEGTGIGIENVKRRLKHIYKDKHYIEIKTVKDQFHVHLILPI